jgi:hypothetical protein
LIQLKQGVDLRGIQPEILLAAMIAEPVFASRSKDLVITAALDGKHMVGSLHYTGRAIDVRTAAAGITGEQAHGIARDLQVALGAQFDVVVEDDHIHIEFDPKEAKG